MDMPMATPEFVAAKARSKFRTMLRDNEIRGVVWDAGTQRERLNDVKVDVVKDESVVSYGVDKRKIGDNRMPVRTNPLYLRSYFCDQRFPTQPNAIRSVSVLRPGIDRGTVNGGSVSSWEAVESAAAIVPEHPSLRSGCR